VSAVSPKPDVERVTEPKQPDRSLGELFADLGHDLSALVRDEMDLARTETRQEIRRAGQAGVSFGTAAVAGLLMLMFLSGALAWLLDQWINRALAFLIVALIWAVVAAVAAAVGRKRTQEIEPIPTTVETLKEDVEWLKQQKS
jgi:F0F1-type ATP synthase assembly protein I